MRRWIGLSERGWGAFALLLLLVCGLGVRRASASVTVLVGEPFGRFGTMLPVGHVAIYLDHLCADGPLKLRECRPGEPEGVVIARYHNIGRVDWIASPVLEFLYAVPRADEVPAQVDAAQVWAMQQRYRRQFLEGIVPDGHERDTATDEWWETAGTAYNRRFWGYRLETSAAQDARLVAAIDRKPDVHAFRWRTSNCANFAADIVNFYYPGTVEVDRVADFGLMTPKQVARAVARYGRRHPEAGLRVFEIAQVPGLRRSRPVRGAAEAALKTKKYLFTLIAIQPEVPAALAVMYGMEGRWKVGRGAQVVGPGHFDQGYDQARNLAVSSCGDGVDPGVQNASGSCSSR